jgi:hypothetical protein
LNRQRLENQQDQSHWHPEPSDHQNTGDSSAIGDAVAAEQQGHGSGRIGEPSDVQASRGRPLVISSCLALLDPLLFYYHRIPAAIMCWTMGQLAFNGAMILILDALETRKWDNIWKVEQIYAVFCELDEKEIHKLAGLAKGWISWGLESIRRMIMDMEREEAALLGQLPGEAQDQSGLDFELDELMDMEGSFPPLIPPMDTVMGNTGMFLLEDPGLQAFSPEGFMPLTWDMAGSNLDPDPRGNRPSRYYKHSFPTMSGLQTVNVSVDGAVHSFSQETAAAVDPTGGLAASAPYQPELADFVQIPEAGIVESSRGINPGWAARGIGNPHDSGYPERMGWLEDDYAV